MKRAGLWTLVVFATACSTINGSPDRPDPTGPWRGGTEPVTVQRDLQIPNVLEDYHTSARNGFDRVEFEFGRRALPGYTVRFVQDAGTLCGLPQPSEVAGTRFIRVTFQPTDSNVSDPWQTRNFRNLRGIRQTCARGDKVEFVIGLREREQFRVLELQNPPRVVIDVRHGGLDRVSVVER